MAEMQNSNPTILDVADLPTRSRPTKKSTDYESGIFAAVPNPADFLSSDSEDDDLLEEPIDEQEIYGKNSLPSPTTFLHLSHLNRPDQVNLGPGTSTLARRTRCSITPGYLHQTHPPQRPGIPPPNSHRPHHSNHHSLQSCHRHRSRCSSTPGAISSPALPNGCAH